jgi:WD40 repeat protein
MRLLRTLSGDGDVTTLAFSRDGRMASGSHDGTVRISNVTVGEEPVALMREPGYIYWLAFNPSGGELASACNDSVSVWDTMTMERKLVLKGNKGTYHLAYSPSGERLATVDRAGLKIWDAKTGIDLLTLPGAYVQPNFSPDGTRLIAGIKPSVHVWDSRPLTTELREEYEARAVVRFHSAASIPRTEVLRLIREDPLLRESLRARALSMAEEQADAAPPH